jgi:hypothetical protein
MGEEEMLVVHLSGSNDAASEVMANRVEGDDNADTERAWLDGKDEMLRDRTDFYESCRAILSAALAATRDNGADKGSDYSTTSDDDGPREKSDVDGMGSDHSVPRLAYCPQLRAVCYEYLMQQRRRIEMLECRRKNILEAMQRRCDRRKLASTSPSLKEEMAAKRVASLHQQSCVAFDLLVGTQGVAELRRCVLGLTDKNPEFFRIKLPLLEEENRLVKNEVARLHARLQTLREAYESSLEAIQGQTTARLVAEEVGFQSRLSIHLPHTHPPYTFPSYP